MNDKSRHEIILTMVQEEKAVRTSRLASLFSVSEETIRRDLIELESIGGLRRVHGGGVLDNLRGIEIRFAERENKNIREKRSIGISAAELINDNETVVLNSGTTVTEVARNLVNKKNLTIITNCFYVATLLQKNSTFRVFFVGGELRSKEMATSGHWSNEFLNHFRADKAILGVGGIDCVDGITDYHINESLLVQSMLKMAKENIIVVDYTKFRLTALNKICNPEEINHLVTDWNSPKNDLSTFKRLGVNVTIADYLYSLKK